MNSKILLTEKYPDILNDSMNIIIEEHNISDASKLLKLLEEAIKEQREALNNQPRLLKFYKKAVLKLKYIALYNLSDKEVLLLLNKNFLLQFAIQYYNIVEKLKQKLVAIISINDRNKFKKEAIKALLANTERITPNHENRTVQSWLKKYIALLDFQDNKLKEAQFLTELRSDKNIQPKELQRLMTLFDVYNLLKHPSDTPQGFEEELPIIMEGKLFIFRQGVLEEVEASKQDLEKAKELLRDQQQDNSSHQKEIEELEAALTKYSPGTLEYRAIEQELKKLKKKS